MGLFSKKEAAPATGESVPVAVPTMTNAAIAAVYYGTPQGGDLYDFVRVRSNLVLFGMLDVAGRHEENAGIVSAAQQTFRQAGAQLFAEEDVNEAEAMIELSLRLNRSVMEAANGVRSCPAFVGCYNETIGTLTYSNAGHTPALLRDQSGEVTRMPATGLPFGLFSHVTHDAVTAALPPGAALALVSRGVTEGRCNDEESSEFGLERVEEILKAANISSAEQLATTILAGVEHFMCVPPALNDVTALVLLREG